jgi:hypothetical protein
MEQVDRRWLLSFGAACGNHHHLSRRIAGINTNGRQSKKAVSPIAIDKSQHKSAEGTAQVSNALPENA